MAAVFSFTPAFQSRKTGQTPCFCTEQKQTRLAIKEDKTTYWNIWIIMETLKLKVTLRQFSLETRHTFTKNFYIASETFKLWPCFCWGQNGDLKKGSVALETGKCAIFDAARSHLHIWLMENGSFLDVFYGDLSIDHCFFHSYVKYPHCMYLRFLLHDSNLTSAPNGYIYINLVSYQHSNEINPWHVGP